MLRVNNLIGFGAGGASGPSIVYLDSDGTGSAVTQFTGLNFGTASADRYIVAGISTKNNSRTLGTITIGGVNATEIGSKITDGDTQVWVVIAAVPTGTSGTLAGLNSGTENWSVSLWALTGLTSSTPYDSASSTADSPTTTACDFPAGSVGLAYCRTNTTVNAWTVPSPMAEDHDIDHGANVGQSGNIVVTGASGAFSSAQTGQTVAVDAPDQSAMWVMAFQ